MQRYEDVGWPVGAGGAPATPDTAGGQPVLTGAWTFQRINLTSADTADQIEGVLNSAIADTQDDNWRLMVLGMNLGLAADGTFTRPDTTRTGWGWVMEVDYMDGAGRIQHEAYLTTDGNERAMLVGLSRSLEVTASIVASGGHSLVTISNTTGIEPYIREGMAFYLSDLVGEVNVAENTRYMVLTRVNATQFHLADGDGVEITNATLTSGTLDRGGFGATASYLPGLTKIGDTGTEAYSTYKNSPTTNESIHAFGNYVAAHSGYVEVFSTPAGTAAGLVLRDSYTTWSVQTFGSLGVSDFGIYNTITGVVALRATTSGLLTMPSFQRNASTAAFDADDGSTGSTLTNITGLTGISLIAGATYKFRVVVPLVTMTTGGGLKMAFKLTTATLTSINARVRQSTDTDNTGAVSTSFVTTTDQAVWFDQKAVVYTNNEIEGTLVVGTAGTIAVQAAQNTAHADNTVIPAGAFAEFTRIS